MNLAKTLIFIIFILSPLQAARDGSWLVKEYFDGEDRVQKNSVIKVKSGRIVAISPLKESSTWDYSIPFAMPPMVDAHVHSTFFDPYFASNPEAMLVFNRQLSNHDSQSKSFQLINDALKKGFLFLRDLGGEEEKVNSLKAALNKTPDIYPLLLTSGRAFASGKAQCDGDPSCARMFYPDSASLSDIKIRSLLRQKKELHEVVKIYFDNDPFEGKMRERELKRIVTLAKEIGLSVAIHVTTVPPSFLSDKIFRDVSFEHIYQFNNSANIQKKSILVPTDLPLSFIHHLNTVDSEKYSFHFYEKERQVKRMEYLRKSEACFGSDFYFLTADSVRTPYYWAIEGLLDYYSRGWSMAEVLRMVTTNCNKVFRGILPKILVGEEASFIGLNKSPFKDPQALHNVLWVIKKGSVLKEP